MVVGAVMVPRSLHDVSDDACVRMTNPYREDDARWATRNSEVLEAKRDRVEGPACLRCYMRGVALHPTLGMCEPCCEHEGVTR